MKATGEAVYIKEFIEKTWPKHFRVALEVRLKTLFPEPENPGLRHIWKHGAADIVAFRDGKPVAIIEPGGGQHFDEKQALNDRRKWVLAKVNSVRCLHLLNGMAQHLSKRKWRGLIGSYLFPQTRTGADE